MELADRLDPAHLAVHRAMPGDLLVELATVIPAVRG
jgi:hypothetical protein